jgi:hypothetical protein
VADRWQAHRVVVRLVPSAVAGAVDERLARVWLGAVYESFRRERRGGRVVDYVELPGPGWNRVRVRYGDDDLIRLLLNAAARLRRRLMRRPHSAVWPVGLL